MTARGAETLTELERRDIETAEAAGRERNRPLVRWAGWASEIADQPQLAAMCAATALAGVAMRRPALVGTGLRMLLAHGLATGAKSWIKNRVRRSRPNVVIEDGHYEREAAETEDPRERSFPSGHTAGALAVAGVVAWRHPVLAAPAIVLAAAASLVQLPRAKHYPSDLAAGAVIGLAAAGLSVGAFAIAARALGRR